MTYDPTTRTLTLSIHDSRRWGDDAAYRAQVRELVRAYARRAGEPVTLVSAYGYGLEEAS